MRIAVHGTSGSGKSTTGRAAAARLGIPYVELDAIRHGPNWVELPDGPFVDAVRAHIAEDAWVIDGNYGAVRTIVDERATHIAWLDLPRWLVMWQVTTRSIVRAVTRRELWNGNREDFRRWLDPDHPIRWAWTTHARRRRDFSLVADSDPRWIRLRSRRAVRAWLASLAPTGAERPDGGGSA